MIRAYSIADVRSAEALAMEALADGELMQRAAEGLGEVIAARLAQRCGARPAGVVALIGGGDNGGDALYACADLARAGHEVTAVQVSAKVHQAGAEAARAAGCLLLIAEDDRVVDRLAAADLVVDGIIGIGGRAGLPPEVELLRDRIPEGAYVMAVDLPSGADPSGDEPGQSLFADETVTFSLVKPVHLLPAGELATGLLTVVDIGVPEPEQAAVERLTRSDLARLWPVPGPFDDKYRRGVLGLVTGGERFPGAAVLTATAAAGAGAGMVRYVGPPTPTQLVCQAVPEAVPGSGRVQAYAVGSGVAADDRTPAGRAQIRAVEAALAQDVPCVVDAGALDLIDRPRGAPTLLTPHLGELARLAERLRLEGLSEVGGSPQAWEELVRARPVLVARVVADRLEATVLVKGAVTLVVPPTGSGLPIRSQADGPAWLATAGSGDVLAGLAGVLLAAGLSPLDAGSVAAAVHGIAADEANPGGPIRALDVARRLGRTIAGLCAAADREASVSYGSERNTSSGAQESGRGALISYGSERNASSGAEESGRGAPISYGSERNVPARAPDAPQEGERATEPDFYHVCFAVPDLDAAMRELTELAGLEWGEPLHSTLGEWPYTLVFSRRRPHIELVSSIPGSPWEASTPRFHHLGWWTRCLDATAAAWTAGDGEMFFDGREMGRNFVYVDAPASGVRLEAVAAHQQPDFRARWAGLIPPA